MEWRVPTQGIEPELLAPLPRRVRRPLRRRLLARLLLMTPLLGALAAFDVAFAWPVVLALAGTPVQARVVQRGISDLGYWVAVMWPRKGWDGAETEESRRISVTSQHYYRLTPGTLIPATRLGRGRLQVFVRNDGDPSSFVAMAMILVITAVGLVVAVGELAVEKWLLARGRPVRGVVVALAKSDTQRPEFTVRYDYWELGSPGGGARLTGSMAVTSEQFEQVAVGQGVTVLHSLWEPRTHVAYSLLPALRPRSRPVSA